jgi:hypothetical protein
VDGPNGASLMIAGYANVREATSDLEALAAGSRSEALEIEAAVLVTCASDYELDVRETLDSMGTTGTELVGAVGVVVGLMSPGTIACAAPGASLCGATEEFVNVRFKYALYDTIAADIPPGSAGIGVVADGRPTSRLEGVLTRSRTASVVEIDATDVALLQRQLADASASVRLEARAW